MAMRPGPDTQSRLFATSLCLALIVAIGAFSLWGNKYKNYSTGTRQQLLSLEKEGSKHRIGQSSGLLGRGILFMSSPRQQPQSSLISLNNNNNNNNNNNQLVIKLQQISTCRPLRSIDVQVFAGRRKKKKGGGNDGASRRVQRMLDEEEEVDWSMIQKEEKEAKERQIEAMRLARATAKGLIKPSSSSSSLSAGTSAGNVVPNLEIISSMKTPGELGIEDFGKARVVQWYPGHIAKAEKALKEQLKMVDVVIEVRDARIPFSTEHPKLTLWTQHKRKLLAINRMESITSEERNRVTDYFQTKKGITPYWTNGKEGKGIEELLEAAVRLSHPVNMARKDRGLLPRAPRVVIVGFPNVGKSALINRLTKRRIVDSAPKVGVTRQLRWVRLGGGRTNNYVTNDGIDLLDTPGLLPMRQEDQFAAQKLAMCNEIGEASYLPSIIAEELIAVLNTSHGVRFTERLKQRYAIEPPEKREFIHLFMERLANKTSSSGGVEQAGRRILLDYQNGKFGPLSLEQVPKK